jgi:hypothetical protein
MSFCICPAAEREFKTVKFFLHKERWMFLIFLVFCLWGLGFVHHRLLCRYHHLENQMLYVMQETQKQIKVKRVLEKYDKIVQSLLGPDHLNVLDRAKITRFLKKTAYQNKFQNFRVLFLQEKTVHESLRFVIKCFSIRLQWLCALDEYVFSFLKALQEKGPGFMRASELMVEKCMDDASDFPYRHKEIVFLKGVYFFDWYTIVSR